MEIHSLPDSAPGPAELAGVIAGLADLDGLGGLTGLKSRVARLQVRRGHLNGGSHVRTEAALLVLLD